MKHLTRWDNRRGREKKERFVFLDRAAEAAAKLVAVERRVVECAGVQIAITQVFK